MATLQHGKKQLIDEIAYYRRWNRTRLLNVNFTWDKQEEEDLLINQQRRDAFWVLTNSMPPGTDFYHLRTGVTHGDANDLYKKVIRIFLAKNPQNRGELRRQFHSLTMASTRLDVSRFAAKVVESASELRKIGAKVDDDEINACFLDGLSKKFDDIVTVETVAENDFDTMLTNVILHAKRNKLLSYRETSSHAYHHMAQEDKRQTERQNRPPQPYKKQADTNNRGNYPQNKGKKKFFKKKERPSGQFKRWSASGHNYHSHDNRNRDFRSPVQQNNQGRVRNTANREQKDAMLFMKKATNTHVYEYDQEGTDAFDIRTKQLKELARVCKQNRQQSNEIIAAINKERMLRRDLQYNFDKLHAQVNKLKGWVSIQNYHRGTLHDFLKESELKSIYDPDDPEEGYCITDLETSDDDLKDPKEAPTRSKYYTNSLPKQLHGCQELTPLPLTPTEDKEIPTSPPKPPRKTRKVGDASSLLMTATHDVDDPVSITGAKHQQEVTHTEEEWLADTGASYHTTFTDQDFDPGSIEECDISVRIGDNKSVHIKHMGNCTRTNKEGRKIILTKVLLSPLCPTRILSVGKLTSSGECIYMYMQDKEGINLVKNGTMEVVLSGKRTPHDTANVLLYVSRRDYAFTPNTHRNN